MIHIALAYDDGRLGVMQWFGQDEDAEIEKGIGKMTDRPMGWRRITSDEADAIRAARPPRVETEYQPSSEPVSPTFVAILQRENDELKDRLAAVEDKFDRFLAGAREEYERIKSEEAQT